MKFARAVWTILVGIKDALVLVVLIGFFAGLSFALSARPGGGKVRDGALALVLDGRVVEERSKVDPAALLSGGGQAAHEIVAHDLVRAIEAAATDRRIKAVTLDLEKFGGASEPTRARVGAALDTVRKAGKPVLAYGALYSDSAYQLAAHASEVWVDPLGGVMVRGPGGTALFYHDLLDRLKVNAHVYRVGTYKSAVEPYLRTNFSPEARSDLGAVIAALWQNWQDDVHRARPRADIARVTGDPVAWLHASHDDAAEAARSAGLVDRIGDRAAFNARVAEIVGSDRDAAKDGKAITYKATALSAYLGDRHPSNAGKPIAVVTVSGEIVDGDAGPGKAGGDRIARLIDKATASGDYSALLVRVDSPGGSVTGAERIRAAIARFKAQHRPVVVSMGGVAASGGYWIATPAERIFADPATITGSIGIFAVLPTFESALAKIGVTSDSVRSTPLSGQPDLLGGTNSVTDAVIQGEIEQGYRRFVGLVAASRHKTPEAVDAIGQGRVWDGRSAHDRGLVDELGGFDAALAWSAHRAGLSSWHAEFLGDEPEGFAGALAALLDNDTSDSDARLGGDLAARIATAQSALAGQLGDDLDRLLGARGAQAYCLECAGFTPAPQTGPRDARARLGWLTTLFGFAR